MQQATPSVAGLSIEAFGQALASEQPTPGGGAAAALAAMLAASLSSMVVRLSLDRPTYAEHAGLHAEALAASDAARARFLELADEDAAAYAGYRAARRLPHATPAQEEARAAATRSAARAAAEVPLELVRACQAQVELVERLTGRTNPGIASDLEVAALLLESGARAAAVNVEVNLDAAADAAFSSAVRAELDQRLQQIQRAADRARERIHAGGGRLPEAGSART